MSSLKNALLAGAFATIASFGVAQAAPLNGTFNISVFTGVGNGDQNAPIEQANPSNPLLAGPALGTGTYTGDLNFFLGGGTDTIGAFLASGGGTLSSGLTTSAVSDHVLSSSGFTDTTLFLITGNVGSNFLSGTVTHDDGADLFAGSTLLIDSAGPTAADASSYNNLTGDFTLYYVEANGLPAVLNFEVASSTNVPEPASMAIVGAGLFGLGFLRRRKNKKMNAANA